MTKSTGGGGEKTAYEKEEELPVITFQYDLDEVYGNPAVVPGDKEYEFQSETKFN